MVQCLGLIINIMDPAVILSSNQTVVSTEDRFLALGN